MFISVFENSNFIIVLKLWLDAYRIINIKEMKRTIKSQGFKVLFKPVLHEISSY